MFCADYIASFIHHGVIVGLWFEYHKKFSGKQGELTTADVPPFHSVLAGSLAGRKEGAVQRTHFSCQDYSEPPQSTLWTLSGRERSSLRRSASVTASPPSPTPGLTSASTSAAGTERAPPVRPAGLSSPPPPPAWRRSPSTRPSRP